MHRHGVSGEQEDGHSTAECPSLTLGVTLYEVMSWTELKVESQVKLKDIVVADVSSNEIIKLLGAGGGAIKEKKLSSINV